MIWQIQKKTLWTSLKRLKESFIVAHLDLKKYFYLNSFFILKYFNRFHLADFFTFENSKENL